MDLYLKEECLQCILVKAGINASACQEDLVEAQQLLKEDTRLPRYLEAAFSHRQSVLARLNADYTASNTFIDSNLSKPMVDNQVDRRLNAWRLHLFVSRLKNLTMQERFNEARDVIKNWNMPQVLSLMERQVHIGYSLVASDIQKSLGQLKLSKDYLEGCCSFPSLLLHDPKRYQIICALVDIRCALGEVDEAESLIIKETDKLRSPDELSKARRRLLVSSLDVDIAKRSESSFAEARSKISDLTHFFQTRQSLDISDQFLHVRTLTASARLYHFQSSFTQAIEEWERVKVLARDYAAFREKGFTWAFSQLSIGYAQIQLALKTIESANSIFIDEKDNYWIPVITTEWLRKIRMDLAVWLQ